MTPVQIDLYSDIVCPWCFVGTRRLEAAIASLEDGLAVEVRHHPYLLHPDAPPDGIDLREMLARKYGADPQRIFERVETAARASGIPLDFSKQSRTYSTLAAHTLLRHAAGKGTQRALADALFTTYFLEAGNISATDVLVDVAAGHAFTDEEVKRLVGSDGEIAETRRQAREAVRSGIGGVPLFVLNGHDSLSGAQPEEVLRDAIVQAGAQS